jgi:hypothetical protein
MSTTRLVFERQVLHLVLLLALLAGLYAGSRLDGFSDGALLGLPTNAWAGLTVAGAIAHQGYVWLCWRLELHGRRLTGWLGKSAFRWYAVGFAILILSRPVLITVLAISNAGTLPGNRAVLIGIAIVISIPALYTMYSVRRYFGFKRAFGIDHFDPAYRSMPLVTKGMFRFSGNAMYDFGFLLLWVPGLACQSVAGVVVALFCHLYIWVHYLCTEKPDMDRIYGSADAELTAPDPE